MYGSMWNDGNIRPSKNLKYILAEMMHIMIDENELKLALHKLVKTFPYAE